MDDDVEHKAHPNEAKIANLERAVEALEAAGDTQRAQEIKAVIEGLDREGKPEQMNQRQLNLAYQQAQRRRNRFKRKLDEAL
eukprot:7048137-Alexandrium_andersonii.AAC.1